MPLRYLLFPAFALSLFYPKTLTSQDVHGEKLSPALSRELTNGKDGQSFKVILILRDQVDVTLLQEQVLRSLPTRDLQVKTLLDALQQKAARTQEGILSRIEGSPYLVPQSLKTFWIANLIALEAEAPLIRSLLGDAEIAAIELDAELVSHHKGSINRTQFVPNGREPGLSAINAPAMWRLGYTGYGRKVLVIDNGQDNRHPALRNQYWYNHVPLRQAYTSLENQDFCGEHGTHVAGIVVGLDRLTRDTIGVAFNGQWLGVPLALKNSDGTDCKLKASTQSDAIGGMQWGLNPDGNNSTSSDIPDVFTNSWGSPPGSFNVQSCFTSAFVNMFASIQNAGVALVFSAGNAGSDSLTVSFPGTLVNDLVVPFTVGAVNGKVSSFPITSFSGRGPSVCLPTTDALGIKPEVVAPGLEIRSAINGNSYGNASGTSMAAPHVAGALLLLKEAFPQVSSIRLAYALYESAIDLGPSGEDNTYGRGIIDVKAAYDLLVSTGFKPSDPVRSVYDMVLLDVRTSAENCDNLFRGTLTVEHAGSLPVTRFNIVLKDALSGSVLRTIPWTGSLQPRQRLDIPISGIALRSGSYDVQFGLELPEGNPDPRWLDNYLKIPVKVSPEPAPSPATVDALPVCANTRAVLRAPAGTNEEIRWYPREFDGNALASGKVFQTGPLSADTTFFAELVYTRQAGMTDPDLGEKSFPENAGGLVFNCLAPFTLKTVTVFVEAVGPRGFILRAPDGKIQQRTINLAKIGENVVTLNFTVTPGNGYKLERLLGRGMAATSTQTSFPYRVPGVLDILYSDNTNPKLFPYFYNWALEYSSSCGRMPVQVKVQPGSGIPAISFTPSSGSFPLQEGKATVNFKGNAPGGAAVFWHFGDGGTSAELNPNYEYKRSGEYGVSFAAASTGGCRVLSLGFLNITGTATSASSLQMPAGTLRLFPQPNTGQFYLWPDFAKRSNLSGRLLSASGSEVATFRWDNLLNQPVWVDLGTEITPGVYFWYFRSDNRELTLPMMVQKP